MTLDWTTISSLATAGGTLVLAVATFSSVRSAGRSARVAERALKIGMRPVLMPSRWEDPPEKISWMDGQWARVPGGHTHVALTEEALYLAIPLRNVGAGIGVIQGWYVWSEQRRSFHGHQDPSAFRGQTRDLYIPAGGLSFWQGALRGQDLAENPELAETIEKRQGFTIDLLYTDHEGSQCAITRFSILPIDTDDAWLATATRHWPLEASAPRD
jgi:hypothetical protein